MNKNVDISVIVPIFRVEKFLTKCIQSIREQTLNSIEIILVDEGENDRCKQIIDYFAAIDGRIIAPHKHHGGYSAACNYAISLARGKYISIIESDDWIEPKMMNSLLTVAEQYGADVVKGPYFEEKKGGAFLPWFAHIQSEYLPKNCVFSAKDFPTILRFHGSVWTAIYKKSYLDEANIRFVNETGGAYVDMPFRYDTLTKTNKIVWLDTPFYHYHVDEETPGTQHNNHSINSFLKRWSELHDRLESEPQDRQIQFMAAMLPDELSDTFSAAFSFDKELVCLLHKNLSRVPSDVINEAKKLECVPLLPEAAKEVESFIRNPGYLKFRILKRLVRSRLFDRFIDFIRFLISDAVLNSLANLSILSLMLLLLSEYNVIGESLGSPILKIFSIISFTFFVVFFAVKLASFFVKAGDIKRILSILS